MEVSDYIKDDGPVKSLVIRGTTTPWKEELKELGAKWNPNLQGGPGWIISKQRQDAVLDFVENANGGYVQPEPVAKVQPRSAQRPAYSPRSAVSRLQAGQSSIRPTIKPASALPSQPVQLNYPNMFTASDGLQYQVIIYTVPLPKVDQKVTITLGSDVYEYVVSELEKSSPPFDSIVILPKEGDESGKQRAVLINGVWKINGMQDDHTITFH